ncbi:MAG: alpha-L-arabinofuranosidase [Ruminococcus sp.]|nr:alpha-L-arabinofuranosidase [Ruminococcus sp.]
MRKHKRALAALMAAAMAVPAMGNVGTEIHAATTVVISPYNAYEINGGVFEGWGTSLCWWANRIGYSDSLAQQAADVFYGDNGLRLNIARFNIGGGDDPSHTHITRTDSNMPGYTVYRNGSVTYDWNADHNQRNVLLKAIAAAGDDMIVEMFSNSPPYYMTESGCSSGGNDPSVNNLKADYFDDFAAYLAEVSAHYQNEWGVKIQSIDAMNEPYTNYWSAYSPKQEGCHFDQGNTQTTIILELKKAMEAKGLGDVILCGTDETSIDTQISSYNALSAEAKAALQRIDTHTYSGSKRSQLKDLAVSEGKNLWMSEVDGGSTAGTNAGEMGAALWLANRITLDVNELNASAWIMWQVIDNHISAAGYNGNKDSGMPNLNGGYWGVAVADHDNDTIILTKKYYAFGQYSRYIRPGMTMLKSSGSTVAAYDAEKEQLVIVAVNTAGSASDMHFDLSGFGSVGANAKVIRTSATENWADAGSIRTSGNALDASLAANSVTTFIIDGVSGGKALENKITVTDDMISGSNAWNNSSNDCFKVFDGSTATYFDGVGNGWVQVDLGNVYDLTAIGYAPRSGFEYRCPDGAFMVSDDGVNWKTVYTIPTQPSGGMNYVTSFSGTPSGRYVRYQVPEGTPNNQWNDDDTYCCNIAEIELYGTLSVAATHTRIEPVAVTGSDAWNQSANDCSKVFDGDTATYFDGVGNGWVQADLGGLYDITAIGFAPRSGYEYRCTDGMFMISQDGANWTTIHTVAGLPVPGMQYIKELAGDTTARYIRYQVPEGAPQNAYNDDDVYCCNIAEIEVYGEYVSAAAIVGDVNCDGDVKIGDVILLNRFLAEDQSITVTAQGMLNAEADGVNGINGNDSVAILYLLAGLA